MQKKMQFTKLLRHFFRKMEDNNHLPLRKKLFSIKFKIFLLKILLLGLWQFISHPSPDESQQLCEVSNHNNLPQRNFRIAAWPLIDPGFNIKFDHFILTN